MNDLFDFVLIMISLVLAIGVTHIVQWFANLVRLRNRIRLQPVPLVWAASMFLVGALYWWSLWDMRGAEWRFPTFFYMLLAPTLFHVAATLLVSTDSVDPGQSVQSQFDRIRVPFMVVMAVFSLVVMWDGWIVGEEPAWNAYRPIQLWTIGLYSAGALLAGMRAQHAIAWLVLATYVVAGFFYRFLPGAFGT